PARGLGVLPAARPRGAGRLRRRAARRVPSPPPGAEHREPAGPAHAPRVRAVARPDRGALRTGPPPRPGHRSPLGALALSSAPRRRVDPVRPRPPLAPPRTATRDADPLAFEDAMAQRAAFEGGRHGSTHEARGREARYPS